MHRLSTGRVVVGYAYRVNHKARHAKPWYRSMFREIGEAIRSMIAEPSWNVA